MKDYSGQDMKVWLKGAMLLQKQFEMSEKRIEAGTQLFLSENQSGLPAHLVRVYGAGIYDNVPIDWLTFEKPITV